MAHWVMQRDAMALMIPSPDGDTRREASRIGAADYARELDALLLMGGSDLCPETYGEKALKPEWNGDRIRDDYEIALLRAFMAERQARARRMPRRAAHQRRLRRHALPGHRHAARRRAQSSQLGHLRREHARHLDRRGVRTCASVSRRDARQDQLGASPGGEGPRPRSRRRGMVGARSRHRGAALERPVVRVRGAVAPGVPRPQGRFDHRRHADSRRLPRSRQGCAAHEDSQSGDRRGDRRRAGRRPGLRRARNTNAPAPRNRRGPRRRSANALPPSPRFASASSRCKKRSRAR